MKGIGLAALVALPVVQTPAVAAKPAAPEARTRRPWPPGVGIAILTIAIILQGGLWVRGFIHLFRLELGPAGSDLTWAIVIFLLFGWAWRWGVAAGYIGGKPTPRFGGT